jgi:hypothetical protein
MLQLRELVILECEGDFKKTGQRVLICFPGIKKCWPESQIQASIFLKMSLTCNCKIIPGYGLSELVFL